MKTKLYAMARVLNFNTVTKTFVYGKARRNDHPKPGDGKIT